MNSQQYTYDRYGDILTITTSGSSVPQKMGVDAATNQIDKTHDAAGQPNNVVGVYDTAGRMTSMPGMSFTYDRLDTVKEATVDGVSKRYLYSATDERIASINTATNEGTEAVTDTAVAPAIMTEDGAVAINSDGSVSINDWSELNGQHIHEIQPVRFGGSPTDPANKIPLSPTQHAAFSRFWQKILRTVIDLMD